MTLVPTVPGEVAALASAEVTTKKLNPPWAPRRPQADETVVREARRRPDDFTPRHRAPRRSMAEWYLQLEGWQLLIIGAGIGATVHAVFSNLLWLGAFGGLG